eukprot:366082-Chlamydomonas_euryale.AAC.29
MHMADAAVSCSSGTLPQAALISHPPAHPLPAQTRTRQSLARPLPIPPAASSVPAFLLAPRHLQPFEPLGACSRAGSVPYTRRRPMERGAWSVLVRLCPSRVVPPVFAMWVAIDPSVAMAEGRLARDQVAPIKALCGPPHQQSVLIVRRCSSPPARTRHPIPWNDARVAHQLADAPPHRAQRRPPRAVLAQAFGPDLERDLRKRPLLRERLYVIRVQQRVAAGTPASARARDRGHQVGLQLGARGLRATGAFSSARGSAAASAISRATCASASAAATTQPSSTYSLKITSLRLSSISMAWSEGSVASAGAAQPCPGVGWRAEADPVAAASDAL